MQTLEETFSCLQKYMEKQQQKYSFIKLPINQMNQTIEETYSPSKPSKGYILIINNQIKQYLKENLTVQMIIQFLTANASYNELKKILTITNFPLSMEDCTLILTSFPPIKGEIKKIYQTHQTQLKKAPPETIFTNFYDMIFIECFCTLMNVPFAKEVAFNDKEEALEDQKFIEDRQQKKTTFGYNILSEAKKYPPLPPEKTNQLILDYQNGNKKSLETLYKHNLRLIIKIAYQYKSDKDSVDDFIQNGFFGLQKAAQRFDVTLGFRFSTYAIWWIRQSISKNKSLQNNPIKLPFNKIETIAKIKKEYAKLEQELNKEPTVTELAIKMEKSPLKIQELVELSGPLTSLDLIVNPDSSSPQNLNAFIPDTKTNVESFVIEKSKNQTIQKILKTIRFTPKEYYVIINYYYSQKPMRKIAEELQVSQMRISQINQSALEKLICSKEAYNFLSLLMDEQQAKKLLEIKRHETIQKRKEKRDQIKHREHLKKFYTYLNKTDILSIFYLLQNKPLKEIAQKTNKSEKQVLKEVRIFFECYQESLHCRKNEPHLKRVRK